MQPKFIAEFDGWEYEITGEDLLYLAVGLYGETRAHHSRDEWARILWTWLNRFMLHGARGKVFKSLAYLIKYHSQPVNPKWRLGGEKCPQVGAPDSDCAQTRLNWRAKMEGYLNAGYEGFRSLPQEIQDFTLSFARGCVPEPQTIDGSPLVDFAATAFAKKYGTGYESGANWFITRNQWLNAGQTMPFVQGRVIPSECGGVDEYEVDIPTSGATQAVRVFLAALVGVLGLGFVYFRYLRG